MSLLADSHYTQLTTRGKLECLELRHPLFSADVLLQGAQLLHFAPSNEDNWLWLSELADYQTGRSVRGGIPICWPWFGNAAYNPAAVQQHIVNVEDAPAHGFARSLPWHLCALEESAHSMCLSLELTHAYVGWQPQLAVKVTFNFSANGLELALTTHNPSTSTQCFSQALHSYFPTADIHASSIHGLNRWTYIDTLDQWCHKQQQGDLSFNGETDRIYYGDSPLILTTPQQRLLLQTRNSQSTVVWNPWIEKSRQLSQFADDAYQRMLCIESANALDDAVLLAPNQHHTLFLRISR